MNRKFRKSRPKLRLVSKPCLECEPYLAYDLLGPEEVMKLEPTSDEQYSLMVYTAAFYTLAQAEPEAMEVLCYCADQIARGHRIELR